HDAGDAEVNQHHSGGLVIQHQIGRLEITVDYGRSLGMYVVKHVADLNRPLADGAFVNDPAANSHLLCEVAAADPAHHQIVPAGLDEVIENGWYGGVIELSQDFRFAFEVLDRLGALALIGEHLDHFFDRA